MTQASPSETDRYVDLAARLLNGSVRVSRVSPARAACWIARRGLECLVADMLRRRNTDPGIGTMRSQLTCVSVTYADCPALVTSLTTLWDELSRRCHHHAYELTPTVAEAQHLVRRLAEAAADDQQAPRG